MIDVVVISLLHARERRRKMQSELDSAGISFRFFDAVNGLSLDEEQLKACTSGSPKNVFKRPLSLPEIGCYLSHFKIWESVCHSEARWTIILEDDADIREDFADVAMTIGELESGPAIIKLNKSRSMIFRNVARLANHHRLVEPWVGPALTIGYAINRQAACQLTKLALPFARPVDIDLKHWWEFGIEMFVVKPEIVQERPETPSSIEHSRVAVKFPKFGIQAFYSNFMYQMRFRSALLKARTRKALLHHQPLKAKARRGP